MKTVMQELIPELIKLRGFGIEITDEYIQGLLKKEKQRMFHCFNAGADRVCDKEFNEWFDQTYNQNK
jgi:hypothetical protein